MRDPLEKHIIQHRELLDVYEPDDRLWERIDREVHATKVISISWMKIAAAVVLLFGLAYTLFMLQPSNDAQFAGTPEPQEFYTPELQEAENYYTSLIATQREQIQAYKAAGIQIDESFMQQLDALHESYMGLQQELVQGEDPSRVISAMMQNLMLQMEVLNQQLMIMEKIKSWQHEESISL